MRRRMVDPEFWQDEEFFVKILNTCRHILKIKRQKDLFSVGRSVRLFYIGLWNYADDSGRFRNNPTQILASIAPYDFDFTTQSVENFLRILQESGRVYLYTVNDCAYGIIVKFLEHQTINRPTPSKLPTPPEPKFSEWLTESAQADSLSDSGATHAQVKLSKVKQSKTAGRVRQTSTDPIQKEAEKVVTRWERKIPGVKLNYGLVKNMLMGQGGFEVLLCGTLERFVDRLAMEVKVKKVGDPLTRFIDMAHKPAGYLE